MCFHIMNGRMGHSFRLNFVQITIKSNVGVRFLLFNQDRRLWSSVYRRFVYRRMLLAPDITLKTGSVHHKQNLTEFYKMFV